MKRPLDLNTECEVFLTDVGVDHLKKWSESFEGLTPQRVLTAVNWDEDEKSIRVQLWELFTMGFQTGIGCPLWCEAIYLSC